MVQGGQLCNLPCLTRSDLSRHKIIPFLAPLCIFLFGCGIAMWFGRQGLNALDSTIVFDGAWRRMSGQAFFQDFATPNGFVPIAMQVLFFKVFGVNWLAYCLHSALMNGLFGLLTFDILRRVGSPRWLAAAYGVLGTVVFYPPMGVPYMEQHAFFFLLLAVWIVMKGAQLPEKGRFGLWLALPTVCLLAILSKQSPGLFALPITGIALAAWVPWRAWGRLLVALLIGLVPALLVFWLLMGWPGDIWPQFWENFWIRPRATGGERLGDWDYGFWKSVRTLLWYPFQALSGLNLIHRYLLYLPFLLALVEWGYRKWKGLSQPDDSSLRLLLLGTGMVVTCSVFMHLTYNQAENGLPLVMVAIGLGHQYYRARIQKWIAGRTPAFQRAFLGASIMLLGYTALCTWDFHTRVNVPRHVLDFDATFPYRSDAADREQVGFLDYQAAYHYQVLRPATFLSWIRTQDGNFLLFGDLSILYGLSGRPSVSPFLWIHEGLTLPKRAEPAFAAADQALESATRKFDIRYVVFENRALQTWKGIRLEDFPQTCASLTTRQFRTLEVGGFLIWELMR